VPNVISSSKRSVTYLESVAVMEWFETMAAARKTGVSVILREATSAYFVEHNDKPAAASLSAVRSAAKVAQRQETARLISSGLQSAAEAQDRNAPIRHPVRIIDLWPALRRHARRARAE
jgi:hypothetical protein